MPLRLRFETQRSNLARTVSSEPSRSLPAASSLHGISTVFYEDRRPALLLYDGNPTSKAAVLSRATATANAAMASFMSAHYKSKLRQGRVRTSATAVTNKWITQPTLFPPDVFRLFASARLGLLPVNAHRQPQTDANIHRQCPHCHVLETAQHTYGHLSAKRDMCFFHRNRADYGSMTGGDAIAPSLTCASPLGGLLTGTMRPVES